MVVASCSGRDDMCSFKVTRVQGTRGAAGRSARAVMRYGLHHGKLIYVMTKVQDVYVRALAGLVNAMETGHVCVNYWVSHSLCMMSFKALKTKSRKNTSYSILLLAIDKHTTSILCAVRCRVDANIRRSAHHRN